MANGTKKNMSPNLEWWAKGVGLLRGGPRKVGAQTWKGGSPKFGAPKGGAPKGGAWGPEGWGPEGWGPEGWGPEMVGPRRVGPKISRFFFPFPPQFFILFSISFGLFREILVVFEARVRSNVHVWSSRAVVCEPRRPGLVGPPGFHTTARELQTCTFERTRASNTTKISRKRPKEREKRIKNCGGRGKKKSEILGGPAEGRSGGGVWRRGPAEGRSGEEGRGSTQILDQTHTADTHRGVRRNRSCGGAVTKRVVRRRGGPAESGENAQNTAHNTRHTTHPTQPKQQHNSTQHHNKTTQQNNNNTTQHTTPHHTTHKPHKPHNNTHHTLMLFFLVPSSVFYFVPMSFFLSRVFVLFVPFVVFYFVPNVCFFVPFAFFLSRQQVAYFVPFLFFLSRCVFFVPLPLLWSVAGCIGWPSRRCGIGGGGKPGRDVVSGEPVVARHPVSRLPVWTLPVRRC